MDRPRKRGKWDGTGWGVVGCGGGGGDNEEWDEGGRQGGGGGGGRG